MSSKQLLDLKEQIDLEFCRRGEGGPRSGPCPVCKEDHPYYQSCSPKSQINKEQVGKCPHCGGTGGAHQGNCRVFDNL